MESASQNPRMVLGIDGGGSKTAALIASLDESGELNILGHGRGGPSNLRLAGKQRSLSSLDQAVDEALAEAGLQGRSLDYAVLALAGSAFSDVRDEVIAWAVSRNLSSKVDIIHDAEPVLASGADDGRGVALIVGTGSVAVGINSKGETATLGGWGHWFGDKGSGFDLGCKALSAVAEATDGVGSATIMCELVLKKLEIDDPRRILQKLSARGDVRREVAAIAPIVLDAAELHDEVANEIVKNAVAEAVKLVAAVASRLAFSKPYPLMLAGGVACSNRIFHDELISSLSRLTPAPEPVHLVAEPVNGCLKIARSRLLRPQTQS
jgi:N-acetylglucosamine kinase-like BadF-type ATPase